MMQEIKIVIPTHKRAEIMTTNIKNQILCVHENEAKDYKSLGFEMITHKETGLSNIRQFVYKKMKDVFMVDDDIVSVEDVTQSTRVKLTSQETYDIIQEAYRNAIGVGAYLFGFNASPNPKHYIPSQPFVTSAYINACAFGLRENENLYFNPKTTACESHWINLLNAYHNRFQFVDKRYHFRQKNNSTFYLEGGQTTKRTLQSEKEDTLLLRKTFGNSVQLKKGRKDSQQLHEYQRKINIKI